MQGLTAFERHKRLLRNSEAFYGESKTSPGGQLIPKTDEETLREQYRFIRSEEDDNNGAPWEIALAQKYYSRLFKEYAIVDLSQHEVGRLGCRWRTKAEVIAGVGQFICGSKACDRVQALQTYEVPFSYKEAGLQKQALVKVRLCQEHGMQLNYKRNKAILGQQRGKRKERGEVSMPKASNAANCTEPQSNCPNVAETKRKRTRREGADQAHANEDNSLGNYNKVAVEVENFLNSLLL